MVLPATSRQTCHERDTSPPLLNRDISEAPKPVTFINQSPEKKLQEENERHEEKEVKWIADDEERRSLSSIEHRRNTSARKGCRALNA